MKIGLLSDTHCQHNSVLIPQGLNMIIHAGDFANSKSPVLNEHEIYNFIDWYSNLNIKYKILIAGNHDTALEAGLIKSKYINSKGIYYLKDETITIEGIKIFGSPYTPIFAKGWAYNVDRSKLHKHWALIEKNTDIIVTHGPPMGILDVTDNDGCNFQAGCKSLMRTILKIQPQYHIFGHLHDEPHIYNNGIKTIDICKTQFMNVSMLDSEHNLIHKIKIIEI